MSKRVTRKITNALISAVFLFGSAAIGQTATITHPKGVVELFTSQGCHSCPAADRVIEKLADEGDFLAISWHVNYWDYLGWKDTFATEKFTARQYRYASSMGERQVYTPQAIINGRVHAVGSREGEVRDALNSLAQTKNGLTVPVNVSVMDDRLRISVDANDQVKDATLYLVSMTRSADVEIGRGENGGKSLKYTNVVKDVQALGMTDAAGFSGEYPLASLKRDKSDCYALILQGMDASGNPQPIIGAVFLEDL